ncbi:MAG TPA: hypothetical protein VKT28_08405, partial [Puia sp.]|nr:hypothetical protein [Puia sp.]
FPVMATARKMVSIAFTFSNPYLDFGKREDDRNNMISFLKTGEPAEAKKLFADYETDFVLLANDDFGRLKMDSSFLGSTVFKNQSFSIFSVKK